MTVSKHTSSGTSGRIVSGPDLAIPSFSCAFLPYARAFCLWAQLDCEHRYQLTLVAATARMATLTGFGAAYAQRLVRQGLGVLWDVTATGDLRLRSPSVLRQQAVQRLGIFKRSRFRIPSDVLGGDLETLHAFLAQPVMAGESGCTSRAYTAGLLGVSIDTVSRWRVILRAHGFLVTAPMFLRLGYVAVAKGGRARPMPAGSGTFQWGHSWYRRGPDAVATVRPKRNPSQYCSLRSQEKNETLWDGTAAPYAGAADRPVTVDELLDRLDFWQGLDNKYDGLTHSILDLLTAYPADQGAPGPHLHAMLTAWEERVQQEVRQWRVLSRSRLASVTDRGTGELDHEACYQLLLAELRRLRGVLHRCRARAGRARDRLARARNVEPPMS